MNQKYALITGASAGIGTYFARCLAKKGYSLVLVARREDRLKQLATELKESYGAHSRIEVCDVSKVEECRNLMERLKDISLEVVINNAGFGICGPFLDCSLTRELDMVDVNVKAVHVLMKLALERMTAEQVKGYILNVASSAGLIPAGPYMATYYATKAYVTSITQAVAQELKEMGSDIYVGCLCPGPVDTEFNSVANVEFALPGISAEFCASYGIRKMFQRKILIIPAWYMKGAMILGKFLPRKLYVSITARQQKKKISE